MQLLPLFRSDTLHLIDNLKRVAYRVVILRCCDLVIASQVNVDLGCYLLVDSVGLFQHEEVVGSCNDLLLNTSDLMFGKFWVGLYQLIVSILKELRLAQVQVFPSSNVERRI